MLFTGERESSKTDGVVVALQIHSGLMEAQNK